MNAQKGSFWKHNLDGIEHQIVEVCSDGVITWSKPLDAAQEKEYAAGGWTWFGPLADFLLNFTFLRAAAPPR